MAEYIVEKAGMEYCGACKLPFWVAITPRADGHKRGPCNCPEYDTYEA